jgi:hypothetical protein
MREKQTLRQWKNNMTSFMGKLKDLWGDERKKIILISGLFGVCGAFTIYFFTPWGPSVGSDSVMYLLSAKNLVDKGYFGIIWGKGSFEPLAHYPPALSLLIAGLYALGIDALSAMRFICIISFGLLLFSVSFLSYKITRKLSLSFQLSILFLFTPFIFAAYITAMSECLFYFFMVTGSLALLLYFETNNVPTLIFSAILSLGAFMSRYVGLTIPLACLIGILFLSQQKWKKRIIDTLIFGLISIGVSLIWFFWNFYTTSHLGGRMAGGDFDLWKSSVEFRLQLSSVIWNWLTLNSNISVSYTIHKISIVLFLLAMGLIGSALFYKVFKQPNRKTYLALVRWIILFALSAGLYIVIYFLAFALTTPPPYLYERIASPIYISVILMIFGMIYLAIELWQDKKYLVWFSWLFLTVLLSFYLPKTVEIAKSVRTDGGGYTSKEWRESRIIKAIQYLPESIPIVTNEPAAVLFLTGRDAIWVSEAMKIKGDNPEGEYGTSLTDLGETVFRNGGALVLFPSFYWQLDSIYYEQTQDRLDTMLKNSILYKSFGPNSGIYFYSKNFVPDE